MHVPLMAVGIGFILRFEMNVLTFSHYPPVYMAQHCGLLITVSCQARAACYTMGIGLQLLELLEDAVSDPGSVLVVAPSLCRIVQGAPGLALQALDKHDAITMLAYVVKKQQQLDNSKVGQATQMPAVLAVHH